MGLLRCLFVFGTFVCGSFAMSRALLAADEYPPSGDAVIRGRAGASEIVISTTTRVAGAVDSLIWNGQEFIDSFDHGRQMQSASSFDCGGKFFPETFNPTEAGSRADGRGEKSSSRLLRMRASDRELETTAQMAFWLAPGETSLGQPAKNDKVLSDHFVSKRIRIGYKDLPHAIQYDVTFTVPQGEQQHYAQFEAVTGYMPPDFSVFWKYDTANGMLSALDDGPGEQRFPVVLATPSGSHAMGVYSPDQPSRGFEHAGYGRFRFVDEQVNKWNCVFRVRDATGIAAGQYRFRMFVIVGTLEDVKSTLAALVKEFGKR